MNKNIFFLIRISLIVAIAGSFCEQIIAAEREEKPVVKARMSFIGGDANNQGVLFQLAHSGYISVEQIGSAGQGKKQAPLYADMEVLEPLIKKANITITKNNIDACKANIDEDYLTAMANYYGEDKEGVRQKLEAALDAFYAKIKGLTSRIDFRTIPAVSEQVAVSAAMSPTLQELFNAMKAYEVDTTTFIDVINNRNKEANATLMKNPFLTPQKRDQVIKSAKSSINRQQLLTEWNSFTQQCSSKSSGAAMTMPFIDLYENMGKVASPLVFIYNALIDLGKVFKFEMIHYTNNIIRSCGSSS